MDILTTPKPSELLEHVAHARSLGNNFIRFEIPPRRKYLERFARLWDGVVCRTVGRRMELVEMPNGESVMVLAGLYVELHITTVLEAARREKQREDAAFMQPLSINQIQVNRPVIRPR